MTQNNLNYLRQQFLDFYVTRGHTLIPSASLIPENDSSTLFTSSGMQPLVPYFFGEPHPAGKRLVNSQKCFRAVDIEEVGDTRHTTFFEMLGNWSLGDYFKQQQLPWIWEFLTDIVGLDPHRLHVTIFAGDDQLGIPQDDEALALWQKLFAAKGITAKLGEHIFAYSATKNWWSRSGTPDKMPAGEPGGTDSEIFYDFGEHLGLHEHSPWHDQPCHPNCDCGRFLEIGNSVFMQYQKTAQGTFVALPQKNVDYGGGLERLIMAYENQADIFATSSFAPLIKTLSQMSQLDYQTATPAQQKSLRLIVDHVRSAIMLLSEGILPSNKGQGYVLRRLLRRCLVNCETLTTVPMVLSQLVTPMLDLYGDVFPDLVTQKDNLIKAIDQESQKFRLTLKKGLREIEKLQEIDGKTAFFLYETYGFPFELTQEIVAQKGWTLDIVDFEAAKKAHQDSSKLASSTKFKGGLADSGDQTVKFHTATHLLLAALRQLLGPQCYQKGSNITGERARFDFTCDRTLTDEELIVLENQINSWVDADLTVTKTFHPKAEALKLVGGSLFADRYPDTVSIYTIEGASREICIGPHVTRTGEIDHLRLGKQQSVSAGVRRLYLTRA